MVVKACCSVTNLFQCLSTLIVCTDTLLAALFLDILQVAHRLCFDLHAPCLFPRVLEVVVRGVGSFWELRIMLNRSTKWFIGPDEALLWSESVDFFDMPVVWVSK